MIKSSKSNSQWLTTSCLRCVVVSRYSTTLFALPEHQRCLLDVRKGNSSIFRPPHSLSEARPPQDPWGNFQHGSCEGFVFSLESQWLGHKNLRKIWDHWNLYAHLARNKEECFFFWPCFRDIDSHDKSPPFLLGGKKMDKLATDRTLFFMGRWVLQWIWHNPCS